MLTARPPLPSRSNVVGSANTLTGEVEYSSYGYNVRTVRAVVPAPGSASSSTRSLTSPLAALCPPSCQWTAAFFTAAFALTFVAHLVQAGFSRRWFLLYTVCLGAGVEMAGWVGRLVAAKTTVWDPTFGGIWTSNDNAFMAQCVHLCAHARTPRGVRPRR